MLDREYLTERNDVANELLEVLAGKLELQRIQVVINSASVQLRNVGVVLHEIDHVTLVNTQLLVLKDNNEVLSVRLALKDEAEQIIVLVNLLSDRVEVLGVNLYASRVLAVVVSQLTGSNADVHKILLGVINAKHLHMGGLEVNVDLLHVHILQKGYQLLEDGNVVVVHLNYVVAVLWSSCNA